MQDFRNVQAWQMAHQLTLAVYGLTEGFPKSESFGLALQLRRTALNAPQRIAEACGQSSPAGEVRSLGVARASQVELEYLLLLARDLGLVREEVYDGLQEQLIRARKTLSGFLKAVERRPDLP